ncbi:hypothetical protein B0T10DRAFT_270336 [Thelonectria olida]|uniref:DUF8035 domain-containing protein n=1 Tax=Thelonectria olida TaxID=1576542 RepID=A0A9P9AUX8_9HYPO|nr:hypothetical protein B0T10DRAFT_270336 [Thelonectria olida]
MSGGSTVQRIDAVDAFARTLYVRAKHSGLAFSDVASAVRQLHLALRHLRVEAADLDSLLNARSHSSSPVYERQLNPMVEDCHFTLQQLEGVLEKYGDGKPSGDERARDDRLGVVQSRLISDRTNVDMFLDTVQLHNPASSKPSRVVDNQPGLEDIKDKVDQIAQRLFRKRDYNSFVDDEDSLWLEFKTELEKEGFAPQVLRKHKDILRAYIREMESVGHMSGGTCPTVRGLLERERSQPASPRPIPGVDKNDKFFVGMRDGRRAPDASQAKQVISSSPQQSFSGSDAADSMALISTNDLIALDSLNSDMAALSMQSQQYGFSPPAQRYLPSHVAGSLPGPELSSSPQAHLAGSSPRSLPPLPPYMNGPPPPYGSSPRTTFSRLAPDRYGNEIPPAAQWTKIKRTLVSPEVLERAGVRYEARPEYVAVLGRLSRDQITEFARQSAEARAARSGSGPRRRRYTADSQRRGRDRADSKSSQDYNSSAVSDTSDTSDSEPDSDDDKGTKSYPFIVNPPSKDKTSPASTVLPKPILKNKNENRVRFDPEPHEVEPRRDRERRHRERSPSRRRHRSRDEGSRRRYSESNGDRYRDREYHGSSRRHHRSERRGPRRDQRDRPSKKAWGETLGAVGIGGAAAGLLSVLAEAAV